jgi:hypothetical protein
MPQPRIIEYRARVVVVAEKDIKLLQPLAEIHREDFIILICEIGV